MLLRLAKLWSTFGWPGPYCNADPRRDHHIDNLPSIEVARPKNLGPVLLLILEILYDLNIL